MQSARLFVHRRNTCNEKQESKNRLWNEKTKQQTLREWSPGLLWSMEHGGEEVGGLEADRLCHLRINDACERVGQGWGIT